MEQSLQQMPSEALAFAKMSISELVHNKNVILGAVKAAMELDMDYGIIPGTKKNTLYKPGAEKLLMMFKLRAEPERIDNLATSDEAHYLVVTKIVHYPTGAVVGYGVGECSSNEEKYMWRKATCEEEYDETPEDRRRHKWIPKVEWQETKTGKRYPKKIVDPKTGKPVMEKLFQVRTNHADLANTILKMADKRSFVGATLKCTAASAVFTQDLEDLSEELRDVVAEADDTMKAPPPETIKEPQRSSVSAAQEEFGPPPPGAQEPEPQDKPPKGTAPASWKRMASKVDGGTCATCNKRIDKGTPILFDTEARRAHHAEHYAS